MKTLLIAGIALGALIGPSNSKAHTVSENPGYAVNGAPVQYPYYGSRFEEHTGLHQNLRQTHQELHWSLQDALRELDRDIRRQHEALHRQFAYERSIGVPPRDIQPRHEAAHRALNRARAQGRAAIREAHLRGHDIIRGEHQAAHYALPPY